jgi:hypothetical protein
MRSLLVILALVIAAVVMRALILRFIRSQPPANSKVLIRITNGRCEVECGAIDALGRQQVAGLVQEAGVRAGFIALVDNRVHFSPSVPPSLHQRLRNIVLNA